MLFLIILVVSLYAQNPADCLSPLKEKAVSLKKYTSYQQADEVKQIIKDIIAGIKKCGFSDNEIRPLVEFQEAVKIELDKKKKKKEMLSYLIYSRQVLTMIEALENKNAKPQPGIKDDKTSSPDAAPQKEKQVSDVKEKDDKKGIPAEKKIETSFPAGDFTIPEEQKKVKKAPVTSIEALKTRLGLMEQRIHHLNGSVGFYRYAFIVIVIITFIILGLMILFILILRSHGEKLNNLDKRASQMHRKISDYTGGVKLPNDEYRVNKKVNLRNQGGKDK